VVATDWRSISKDYPKRFTGAHRVADKLVVANSKPLFLLFWRPSGCYCSSDVENVGGIFSWPGHYAEKELAIRSALGANR